MKKKSNLIAQQTFGVVLHQDVPVEEDDEAKEEYGSSNNEVRLEHREEPSPTVQEPVLKESRKQLKIGVDLFV
jgi:hypothetical protein